MTVDVRYLVDDVEASIAFSSSRTTSRARSSVCVPPA
jgi:hypothetical protein